MDLDEYGSKMVGCRIEVVNPEDPNVKVGYQGTILDYEDDLFLVEFDKGLVDPSGHDGQGRGEPGHCWWICDHEFKVILDEDQSLDFSIFGRI